MADQLHLAAPDAERYVIGAIFKEPKHMFEILSASNVTSDWFFVPRWRYTFNAMSALRVRGSAIEPAAVLNAAKVAGEDKFIGNSVYEEAIQSCKDVRNVRYYLDILKDCLAKRVLCKMADDIQKNALCQMSADEMIGKIKWSLSSELPSVKVVETVDDKLDALGAAYKQARKSGTTGLPYRWKELHAMTAGMPRGKVVVVGARPKVGKTQFMCNQTFTLAASYNLPVGIIEIEMSESEIRERFIGDDLNLELFDFRSGRATDAQIKEFIKAGKRHKEMPINIFDGNRTIENICMVIRDQAKEIPFWCIDYMQRIKQSKLDPRSDRERYERYSNMITDVANETGVTIMALCQLNREAEFDIKGKRILPQAKHLKGSGAFEQDAHQVVLLGRGLELDGESEYDDDQPTIVRVAYNRTGYTGDIEFLYRKSQQKFIEKSMANVRDEE